MARFHPDSRFVAGGGTVVMDQSYPAASVPSLALQRYDRENSVWVTAPSNTAVKPDEQVRAISDGLAPFKTVKFWVTAEEGDVVLSVIAQAGLGGGVNAAFAAPQRENEYVLMIEVDGRTQASLVFTVDNYAREPAKGEKPTPGVGGTLLGLTGNLKWIVLGGAALVGLVVVGPSIAGMLRKR